MSVCPVVCLCPFVIAVSLAACASNRHPVMHSLAAPTHQCSDDGEEMKGTADNDIMVGGSGDDMLSGGEGADVLAGGGGEDRLRGGPGDDMFVLDETVLVKPDILLDMQKGDRILLLPTLLMRLPPLNGRLRVARGELQVLLPNGWVPLARGLNQDLKVRIQEGGRTAILSLETRF